MLKLTISCFLFSILHVIAVPLLPRVVFDPPITSPTATSVWKVGQIKTVTWDISNLPPDSELTNPNGTLVLGFLSTEGGENLMLDNPLAKGFKLRLGKMNITVPSVVTRDNYIVVLMGSSGNASPEFKIEGAAATSSLESSSTSSLLTDPIPITGSSITGGISVTPSTPLTTSDGSVSSATSTPSSTASATSSNTASSNSTSSSAPETTSPLSSGAWKPRSSQVYYACGAAVLAAVLSI